MLGLMLNIAIGVGVMLALWLLVDSMLCRGLRRLERVLPSDIVGPGAWLTDTANQSGIFDRSPRRRAR